MSHRHLATQAEVEVEQEWDLARFWHYALTVAAPLAFAVMLLYAYHPVLSVHLAALRFTSIPPPYLC